MELQEKESIYENNISILSMSRVDEESGCRTMRFSPPSHLINSQHSISKEKKFLRIGFYNILISVLIVTSICIVIGAIYTTLYSYKLNKKGATASLKDTLLLISEPISLNDIIDGDLSPDLFNGTWITSTKLCYSDEYNNLVTFDVTSLKKEIIINNLTILIKQLHGELLSKDLNYLLSPYETSKTFRHSTLSRYKIYNIRNDSFSYLLPDEEHNDPVFIQYVEWGPNGTQIIFVYENNIYYKSDVNAIPIQLTATGVPNIIYNGLSDWVYEEEILDEQKAFWVSPDGRHLVYATINDTEVESQIWPFYGEYVNLTSNQYPVEVSLKYPKPGRNNPTVEIFVLNLNNSVDDIEIVRLNPPQEISKQ